MWICNITEAKKGKISIYNIIRKIYFLPGSEKICHAMADCAEEHPEDFLSQVILKAG